MEQVIFSFQPEWVGKVSDEFLGDDYPAYASQWMARAVGVLSDRRDQLLTSEEWEVAAGNLREEKYFGHQMLAEVAVFGRSHQEGPTTVGTKRPNQYGLQDMLGLVWEYVAEEGVVRGGAWDDNPGNVRAAFLGEDDHPVGWYGYIGFRLFRPQDSPA